jgi:hypothetical protein
MAEHAFGSAEHLSVFTAKNPTHKDPSYTSTCVLMPDEAEYVLSAKKGSSLGQ